MDQYIVALITAIIGAVGLAVRQWLTTKLKPQQFNAVVGFATDVVAAAEQAGAALGWDGPAKYEYAQTSLESLAKRVGITLKPEESNAIIHASVKAMKDIKEIRTNTAEAQFQQGAEYMMNRLINEYESSMYDARAEAAAAPAPETIVTDAGSADGVN